MRLLVSAILLFSTTVCNVMSQPLPITADIVVSGGSFGAPAAALAAARAYPAASILLIEPTDWLGGQATSQGVSAIDNAWHQPAQALMANNPAAYYPADYLQWINGMKNPPAAAPGEGMGPNGTSWVSRESYDPRTGAWLLDQMVAAYPQITVMKMTVVKNVTTSPVADEYGVGQRIETLRLLKRNPSAGYQPFTKFLSAEMPDWYNEADSADFTKQIYTVTPANPAVGMVVIDASETGDAIVLSGASYVVGREQTTEAVSAAGVPPAHYENASQATVFPFCITSATTPNAELGLKAPWADFDTYYASQKAGYFSLGAYTWQRVWSYRRLKTTGAVGQYDSVYPGDVTMQNWYPGNDYPYQSIYLTRAGATAQAGDWRGGLDLTAVAGAEKIALAWYFYMKERRPTTWDTHYLHGDDELNMMGTPHGLAKFPYIRCGRRLLGAQNFRLLQRYLLPSTTGPGAITSYRFYDSVGIGNYAMDSHAVHGSMGVSHSNEKPAPFYLPYRALPSANVRNLLAGCKSFAGTYWTNSAYRLHPIEWAVGSAAGVAAAHMQRDGRNNLDLLKLPALRQMQTAIAENSPIHWAAYDAAPLPPKDGDLVVNDLRSVIYNSPVPVQIYCFGSTRAEVRVNGQLLGETTTRVNDHLLYDNARITTNPAVIEARCFDGANNLLATLTVQVPVTNVPDDPYIVDNSDPRFSVTGSWSTASSQANRYGADYRYTDGVGGLRKATWQLTAPAEGDYLVSVWYPQSNNRATDAPFTVFFNGGSQTSTVRVNQRQTGGQWLALGVYRFTGAPGEKVELTNAIADPQGGTNLVLADAVRIQPVPASGIEGWSLY